MFFEGGVVEEKGRCGGGGVGVAFVGVRVVS